MVHFPGFAGSKCRGDESWRAGEVLWAVARRCELLGEDSAVHDQLGEPKPSLTCAQTFPPKK